MASMSAQVGWLLSLPRSGSSIAAYAAAAPWNHPVADEPFGPQVRTAPPYGYPAEQADLVQGFARGTLRLDERLAAMGERVLQGIAAGRGFVVCKVPHLNPTIDEISRFYPSHRVAMLLRNPLHRLNSYYLFGMEPLRSAGPFEVQLFKSYAAKWRQCPCRVVYDDMKRNPARFFGTLWAGWGLAFTDADVAAADSYRRGHYHASCLVTSKDDPESVRSQREWRLPDGAIEAYLSDAEVRDLMVEAGWSVNADDYRAAGVAQAR